MILSPSGFFSSPDTEENSNIDWKRVASQTIQQTAELASIVYALKEVEKRWRSLNEHIGSLLTEDFMDSKSFTKLLFDDETFSRSRLYFWVVGCLNEFDVSIEDNIRQWKLFRQARINHLIDSSSKYPDPEPGRREAEKFRELDKEAEDSGRTLRHCELEKLRELDKEAQEIRQSLEDLQAQFKAKQTTVQALRDGVSRSLPTLCSPSWTCS